MGIQTSFHADQGEFLGLRISRRGEIQVVYDNGAADRQVWRVMGEADLPPDRNEAELSEALRIASGAPRVLSALHHEMKKRAIVLESLLD
jgi:hypothetical protein